MMKSWGFIVGILVFCFYACTDEIENVSQHVEIGISEARRIARTYLVLEEERYVLNLEIDEAERKGISKELYTQLLLEVEESNFFLQELINEGVKITLVDPQEVIGNSDIVVKTRTEGENNILKQGMISVKDYQTKTSISAPRGAKKIVFSGTTPCFLVAISITCNGSVGTITSGPWGGSCSFQISYSPCVLNITTHTLCSGGGSLGYIIYG